MQSNQAEIKKNGQSQLHEKELSLEDLYGSNELEADLNIEMNSGN